MTYEYVHRSEVPSPGLIFDGETYSIECDGEGSADETDSNDNAKNTVSIPTKEYAIHLIHMVRFHCCQLFHLYDEREFMGYLDAFYARPPPSTPYARKERLWYIHFLLLLAFGKAFISRRCHGRRPPGAEFFTRAMELLPSTVTLLREPMMSVEILICLALYIHCLDYRMSAYNYVSLYFFSLEVAVTEHVWQIGQAIRLAMCNGMHGYVSPEQVGQDVAQRYQKIWSTVYVLDCEMTSWQGLPPSVNSEDVCTPLPTSLEDPRLASALAMRVKLSRVIARVNKCRQSSVILVLLFMTDAFLPQQFTVRMGAWMADFSCGPRKHCRGLQSLPTHFNGTFLLFSTMKQQESPGHPLIYICSIIRHVC